MSLENLFSRYGSPCTSCDERIYIYMTRADHLSTCGDVIRSDKHAAEMIETLERYAADLREYRQTLAARYAELETMSYKRILSLIREPRDSGIKYYVSIEKVFSDGTKNTELRDTFPGKERAAAFKRFADLGKMYPGIETVKDIERRSWER